jgi:hypothetical protein
MALVLLIIFLYKMWANFCNQCTRCPQHQTHCLKYVRPVMNKALQLQRPWDSYAKSIAFWIHEFRVWDFMSSWCWIRPWQSSGMWLTVVWWMNTIISEELFALIMVSLKSWYPWTRLCSITFWKHKLKSEVDFYLYLFSLLSAILKSKTLCNYDRII